jgi:hypothetical protein
MNGMFSCSLDKNNSGRKSLNAVTALTRNGHTMTRCCGNLEAHFQRHYNGNHPGENVIKVLFSSSLTLQSIVMASVFILV